MIFSNPVFICLERIIKAISVSVWESALMWTSWGLAIPSSEAYKWSYYPSYNIIQEAITKFLFQARVTSWASSLRWRMPMSHSGETVLTEVRHNPQPTTLHCEEQKNMYLDSFIHLFINIYIFAYLYIFQDINVSYHLQTLFNWTKDLLL